MSTLPCEFDDKTKYIEHQSTSISPFQFIREYFVNSIEAIGETGNNGSIYTDFNRQFFAKYNVYKLCFIDTGIGINQAGMESFIKNLSSSGGKNNKTKNHGIGAKIAAFPRNKFGIIYDSWIDGKGLRCWIHYDDDEGIYGLKEFTYDDGACSAHVIEIDDSEKPKQIDQHGTRVTLLGNSLDENTMKPIVSNAMGGENSWIHNYANLRFFKIPSNLKIICLDGYKVEENRRTHQVFGQKNILDKHKLKSGCIDIDDAKIYWWLLDPKRKKRAHGRGHTKSFSGCLNGYELFNIKEGKSSLVSKFGLHIGDENVVIIVHPNENAYIQDWTRSFITKKDGTSLPWMQWPRANL